MLDSDHLRTFIAIADTKNFTKAGDSIGRTQSAISAQMRKLESTLGETLFDRQSRGVQLTCKGEELLIKARRIVSLLDDTATFMKTSQTSPVVKFGITDEITSTILPLILDAFTANHPEVEVVLKVAPSITHLDAIARGALDVAIVYARENDNTHEVLRQDEVVWVTSIVHQAHLRDPLPVAMYSINTWARAQALNALEMLNRPHRFIYHAEGSSVLVPAVQAGIAIAPIARSVIPLDCRELTEAEGFPIVEASNMVLARSNTRNLAADWLASAVKQAFRLLV